MAYFKFLIFKYNSNYTHNAMAKKIKHLSIHFKLSLTISGELGKKIF